MSLAAEYKRQFAWRSWPVIFDALPALAGQTVLDLGCGVGDQAAELVARGARVIGIDLNEELLQEARSRGLASAEFRSGDLRALPDLGGEVDGVWSSFTAAYFPDLTPVLAAWGRYLKPRGWIALTEVDDLFGHEPLRTRTRSLLERYARQAHEEGRYDFHMGRKLPEHLERSGFAVSNVLTVEDHELSFAEPARPEVIEAWRARLERMAPLRDLCGARFDTVRDDFLGCLTSPAHHSLATVYCCIGTKR